jgi:DNA-binding MurR/RpiR family transcriptional regulator
MRIRTKAGHAAASLVERLKSNMGALTQAERRVAHVLFGNNLMFGLDTVAALAARARVSGPTVLRFVAKQGFSGYPEFQRALREELSARMSSPLMLYRRGRNTARSGKPHPLQSGLTIFGNSLQATLRGEQANDISAIARLAADRRRRLWLVGGRFSQMLAENLWAVVRQLRDRVELVPALLSRRQDALIDVRRDHFVIAFDFRRYQSDTIVFTSLAARRGAKIALVTDRWLSPIAKVASHIVTCDVEAPSPFDSFVAPMAMVEMLVASVTTEIGIAGRKRIEELERTRRVFDAAARQAELDSPPAQPDRSRRGAALRPSRRAPITNLTHARGR